MDRAVVHALDLLPALQSELTLLRDSLRAVSKLYAVSLSNHRILAARHAARAELALRHSRELSKSLVRVAEQMKEKLNESMLAQGKGNRSTTWLGDLWWSQRAEEVIQGVEVLQTGVQQLWEGVGTYGKRVKEIRQKGENIYKKWEAVRKNIGNWHEVAKAAAEGLAEEGSLVP